MAITDLKLTTYAKDVSALSDTPNDDGLDATQVKAVFMGAVKEEIKTNFNALIDALGATTDGNSGADNIGVTTISGVTGNTAQTALEGLKTVIDNTTIGQIPDNSLTNAKLGTDVKVGSLATLTTTEKSSVVGALNEVNASLSGLQGERLISNVTIYVATTGSDTIGDGTSGNPYATFTKVLLVLPKNLNGHTVTIEASAGTYTESITINGYHGGNIYIGSTSNIVNIVGSIFTKAVLPIFLSVDTITGGNALTVIGGSIVNISKALTVNASGSLGISVYTGGKVIADSIAVTVNNASRAINTNTMGDFYATTLAGSGNTIGLIAGGGSSIKYNASTLSATTPTSTNNGGRILSGGQTNIPNY